MDITTRVKEIFQTLHAIPEVGFNEHKTAAYLAAELGKAGYQIRTGIGGTGITGVLDSGVPGPVIGLRADMDALAHTVDGVEKCVHSCGHDAHCAMVLAAAEVLAEKPPAKGKLKIVFQPAEEKLDGALSMIKSGAVDDLEILFGIHLRPIQEAKSGQATPALYHGASYIATAAIKGAPAHGARPHLGINAIDAATAVVGAINAIHLNPADSWSVKTTKLHAGGPTLNAIPDLAEMAFDLRAQSNAAMDALLAKLPQTIENAAAAIGATADVQIRGGVPAAEYDAGLTAIAGEAIRAVLGEAGLLAPIITPGGEDFHYFTQKIPGLRSAYIGLGCNLTPGLHHPDMTFDTDALPQGVAILLEAVRRASS
ncbi:amidohydrolase [Anaeroselena agilis]|uniref:Amidohydrolase n=1 Tax=Anaeroselena agilis TaxID=3063788 RepID=A0ABU3P1Y3_9FIRM|nr:amidohydrolase [Selenomonadales bacterium 4137-cl]